jgi:hypothetical protein
MLAFLEFIPEFDGAILSVADDVRVDSMMPVVTLSVSRFAGPNQFFEDAHTGKVCVCVHRVSVRSYM